MTALEGEHVNEAKSLKSLARNYFTGIGFIDILYHNVIIPNVYRSKTLTWNTCCKKNKMNSLFSLEIKKGKKDLARFCGLERLGLYMVRSRDDILLLIKIIRSNRGWDESQAILLKCLSLRFIRKSLRYGSCRI